MFAIKRASTSQDVLCGNRPALLGLVLLFGVGPRVVVLCLLFFVHSVSVGVRFVCGSSGVFLVPLPHMAALGGTPTTTATGAIGNEAGHMSCHCM